MSVVNSGSSSLSHQSDQMFLVDVVANFFSSHNPYVSRKEEKIKREIIFSEFPVLDHTSVFLPYIDSSLDVGTLEEINFWLHEFVIRSSFFSIFHSFILSHLLYHPDSSFHSN